MVDDDLVVEGAEKDTQSLTDGLPAVGLVRDVVHFACRRGLVAPTGATGSAGPAGSPRYGSRPGSTRSTRCPAAGSARPAARPAAGGAGSAPARPARTAGPPPCRSRPAPGRPRPPWCPQSAVPGAGAGAVAVRAAVPVQFHAQPDQVLQRVHVHVAGDQRGHAASHATASAASPSSQAPPSLPVSDANARHAAHRSRTCAVHCSCSAESPSSSSRSASEICTQAFTGCPARSGSRFAGHQPPHRLGQRVVVPLVLRPVVLFPGRGAQRVQHPPDHLRALRRSGPRAAPRRRRTWSPASRRGPRSPGPGPGPDPGSSDRDRSYICAASAASSSSPSPAAAADQQQLVGLIPELLRQPVRPQADQPPDRLRDLPRPPAPPPPSGGWRSAWPRRRARRRRPG